MGYIVHCMVGLTVLLKPYAGQYKQEHLNIELQGIEVKELNSEYSLVDFCQEAARLRLPVDRCVLKQQLNLCAYERQDVDKFNQKGF